MKLRAVIIAVILLAATSVAAGELRFIQDSSGITSHVMYNGQLYPVASDGTVMLDGSKIPVTVLMAAAQPQQPSMQPAMQPQMQPPQQWQNPDHQPVARQPQYTQPQPTEEYKHTQSAAKREYNKQINRAIGNGPGSGLLKGISKDILGF